MILCHILWSACSLFYNKNGWNGYRSHSVCFHYHLSSLLCFRLPPSFLYFPLNLYFTLHFFPVRSTLSLCLPSLCLPLLPFPSPSPPSQPISASYEVWKMIVCRMKWTEFVAVMAWQNESRPSSSSITAPRQPRLGSVKVLAYWLLVVTIKCLIQCLWHGMMGEGGKVEEGDCRWVEGTAGSCSTLKNPLLIDFKWWNIDLCLVQGLVEQATAIYRRCNAGHPVLLATISHSDRDKNERKR